MKRKTIALVCALTLAVTAPMSMLGCGGCAGSRQQKEQNSSSAAQRSADGSATAGNTVQDMLIRPAEKELSPQARATFAYLLFTQALLEENEELLMHAAPMLSQTDAPARLWLEGGVWLMGRKSENAPILMDLALNRWPDDMSLNLLYAEILMEFGQNERGVALMRSYLAKFPDALDARLELGLLLVKTRAFDEAEKIFTKLKAEERSPLVNYYHARALIGMNRQQEAIGLLRKAIKEMPEFAEALAELAFIHEQRNELKEARAVYEKLLKFNLSNQEVILRLIGLSLRLQQPEKALQYLEKGPDTVSFKLTAAGMFIDARHYLQAEALLKKLVTSGKAPDEIYLLLAELVYEQRHDLAPALQWLDKLPAGSREASRALLLRAQLLTQDGQEPKALAVVQQGRKEFKDVPEFWEFEVRLLARQGQLDKALETTRAAVKNWPDNMDMAFLLGSLLDEQGSKDEAMQTMEAILLRQPDNYQALNYVGYTLADQGRDLDRAVELLVKANELSPNQAYIVDSLAWALFKSGRLEEALKEIRRGVTLGEVRDPSIWEHYGDIAGQMGLTDEARKAYGKSLELKPDNAQEVREKQSKL